MTPQLHDLSDKVGPIPPTSATDRQRARLAVCARAVDVDDALTGGTWRRNGHVLHWTPDPEPAPEPASLADLIACPTCRASVTETCHVVNGKSRGRRRSPHRLRLTARLCPCGELAPDHAQMCRRCASESLRASKRDYMRRRRAATKGVA